MPRGDRTSATAGLLLATLLASRPAAADVVSIAASQDNTLYQSATGSVSNGAGQVFFTGRTSTFTNSVRRALIAFDVAGSVPAGSTIDSVTLTLHLIRTPFSVDFFPIALHRVLASWGEGTSDATGGAIGGEGGGAPATPGDATWLHRFYNTVFWTTPGGDFAPNQSASIFVSGVAFYTWGPTDAMRDDVQGWLDNPAGNFGWMLRGDEVTLESARGFDSRQSLTAANRPVLTVQYTPPAAGAGRVPDGRQAQDIPLMIQHAPGAEITLSWSASCLASDTDYEVYEGSLGSFYSHTMKLCTTGGATTATFMPAPGDSYYLVVPRNGSREGSYGIASSGAERPAGVPACLPQSLAACP
jgi:hypothetical protein